MSQESATPSCRALAAPSSRVYPCPVFPHDTDPRAQEAQIAAARKLGPEGRVRLAAQMSEDVRRISIEGMRRRHPDYCGVLATMGDQLDRGYVERWVRELGLEQEWAVAQKTPFT